MQNLRVTFHMDGTGVVGYAAEPPHLDGILSWAWRYCRKMPMDCDPCAVPEDAELPLARVSYGSKWVWAASALIPNGEKFDSIQMVRRRTNVERLDLQSDSIVHTECGPTKNTNRPWNLILVSRYVAYCVGQADKVEALARQIYAIGAERGRSKGRVSGVNVDIIAEDYSCEMNSVAMRYLPHVDGVRFVRCRPPYWHNHNRCKCLSPGDAVK